MHLPNQYLAGRGRAEAALSGSSEAGSIPRVEQACLFKVHLAAGDVNVNERRIRDGDAFARFESPDVEGSITVVDPDRRLVPVPRRGRSGPGHGVGERRLRQLHTRGVTHGRAAGRGGARRYPDRRTIAADALLFAVPLYNFGVSQHFKAWVDMVITDPRMAAGTQPILAGKPAVLVTVRGGNYRVGTPREGWDHATGWMRRILADVWHLDLKVVQAEFTLVVSIPHWTSSPISPASCARRPKRRRAATAASLAPRSPLPPRRPREACARLSARPDPMGEKLLSCGAGGSWWWLGGGRS